MLFTVYEFIEIIIEFRGRRSHRIGCDETALPVDDDKTWNTYHVIGAIEHFIALGRNQILMP